MRFILKYPLQLHLSLKWLLFIYASTQTRRNYTDCCNYLVIVIYFRLVSDKVIHYTYFFLIILIIKFIIEPDYIAKNILVNSFLPNFNVFFDTWVTQFITDNIV